MVRRRLGVQYTLAGLDLLLHWIGWSVQVPARRAAERDEAAIAAWREEAWPVIYRVHHGRSPHSDRRKGFTETDYARLLDAAHQQLRGPSWSSRTTSTATSAAR